MGITSTAASFMKHLHHLETSSNPRSTIEAPTGQPAKPEGSLWQHHTKGLTSKKCQIRLLLVFGAEDLPIPVAAADVCRQGLADQDVMGILPRDRGHVCLNLKHQVGDAPSDGEDWKILHWLGPPQDWRICIASYCGYGNNKPPLKLMVYTCLYHPFMVIRDGLLLLYQQYH